MEKLPQILRYDLMSNVKTTAVGAIVRTPLFRDATLKVPKLKGVSFDTATIERYRCQEISVKDSFIEKYLADGSVRRIEDIAEALWIAKVSPATINELNKKAYVHLEG